MGILINNINKTIDHSQKTAYQIFLEFKNQLPPETIAVLNNGQKWDWYKTIPDGSKIDFITFSNPQGKYVYWHSTAHLLAQAILRVYPTAKPTIGPPINEGFYYDFANLDFSEHDFLKIEEEMYKIIDENLKIERIEFANLAEAKNAFADNPFKLEIAEQYSENLSAYRQGEFVDLCLGPHLSHTSKISNIKILKTSGSYWRGDSTGQTLTRIYGISFPQKNELKNYLYLIEEAKKRDHRLLGKKHDLFSFNPVAPGLPFIHHKGNIIFQQLLKFWKQLHDEYDYQEIKTPGIMRRQLWETSGHWKNYLHNMYTCQIDDEDYAIKPMNCPGCCLYFNSKQLSYRQLPLRIAEIGTVYRHELHGVLSGLFRVRCFNQDDSHLFMQESQIAAEVSAIIDLAGKIYGQFGLTWRVEVSTRPEEYIGSDEVWENTTSILKSVLDDKKIDYIINEGDGAFYGPKIDFHIEDALKRSWQCGTIQLDMNLPERFDVTYIDEDGSKQRPVMLHRTIYGSIERFMAIIIEHYAARFPLWLAPVQFRVLTIKDSQQNYAITVNDQLRAQGFRSEVDFSNESLNKKIKMAQLDQINYILVVGPKEEEQKTVALRLRSNQNLGSINLDDLIAKTKLEDKKRLNQSIFLNS